MPQRQPSWLATNTLDAQTLHGSAPALASAFAFAPECQAAYHMSNQACAAASPNLLWPVFPPDIATAKIVLSRNQQAISGGDALDADRTTLAKQTTRPHPDAQTLYWQRSSQHGQRLVVVESPFNWRGDCFYCSASTTIFHSLISSPHIRLQKRPASINSISTRRP